MTEPRIGDTKVMDGGTIWRLTEHDDKGDVWEQIGFVSIKKPLPLGGFPAADIKPRQAPKSRLQAREDAAFAARYAAYARNPKLYLIIGWTSIAVQIAVYIGLFVAMVIFLKPVGPEHRDGASSRPPVTSDAVPGMNPSQPLPEPPK